MKHKISNILMQGIIYMNKRLADINSTLMDISKSLKQQNLLLKNISRTAGTDMVTNMKALHTAREATKISREAVDMQKTMTKKQAASYTKGWPGFDYLTAYYTCEQERDRKREAAAAPGTETERFIKQLGNWIVDGYQVIYDSNRKNLTTNLKAIFGELNTEIIAATLDIEEALLDRALSASDIVTVGMVKYIAAKLKISYKVLTAEQPAWYIKRLGELWRKLIFSADQNDTITIADNQTAHILGQLRRWEEKGVFDD